MLALTLPRALAVLALLAWTGFHKPERSIAVTSTGVAYAFGQQVDFSLSAEADSAISEVTLFFRPANGGRTLLGAAEFVPGPSVTARYLHRIPDLPIAPFSPVEYWWQLRTQSGEELTTPPERFLYEDNRFTWQRLAQDGIEVHWYEGDTAFGQAAMDVTVAALRRIDLGVDLSQPAGLRVYVYADAPSLQAGLRLGGRNWVGGHADPDLGVVLVSVQPGLESQLELEREIPHELAHVLLYHAVGSAGYPNVPNWLNEGLAVLAEGIPDPERQTALAQAAEAGELLPLEALCGPFPVDAWQAGLAYAESESVVRFIREQYGLSAIGRLLGAYADGASCASGVQRGLGQSLAQVQQAWLSNVVYTSPLREALRALAPYALLSLLVGVPWLGRLPVTLLYNRALGLRLEETGAFRGIGHDQRRRMPACHRAGTGAGGQLSLLHAGARGRAWPDRMGQEPLGRVGGSDGRRAARGA